MDKPTFASVYSTAAILAAFSRASASGDETACGMVASIPPSGVSALDACAAVMRRWAPVRPRALTTGADRVCFCGYAGTTEGVKSHGAMRNAPVQGEPQDHDGTRPRVTSHFAFGESVGTDAICAGPVALDP